MRNPTIYLLICILLVTSIHLLSITVSHTLTSLSIYIYLSIYLFISPSLWVNLLINLLKIELQFSSLLSISLLLSSQLKGQTSLNSTLHQILHLPLHHHWDVYIFSLVIGGISCELTFQHQIYCGICFHTQRVICMAFFYLLVESRSGLLELPITTCWCFFIIIF